jgi:hypothetical protein
MMVLAKVYSMRVVSPSLMMEIMMGTYEQTSEGVWSGYPVS